MSFREKSAWLLAGIVLLVYAWYLATVLPQIDGGSVSGVSYQRTAVAAAIAVVVLLVVSHVVLAAFGKVDSSPPYGGTAAIKRYARSTGGVVISAAAVIGMALAVVEADYFWIANVILAGLVFAELSSAGTEIRLYRRGA